MSASAAATASASTDDDGEYFEVGGIYREVVPNERLVFTWAWHSTPERESLVTITLKPDGAGTLLTFHHEQFFDETARDNHQRGWSAFLDKLEQPSSPDQPWRSYHATAPDRLARAMDRGPQGAPGA